MANNIRMWQPPGGPISQVMATGPQNSGQTYTADPLGFVAVDPRDVPVLRAGFTVSPPPSNNFRNLFDGGDFAVNPFQRNIAGLASSNVISSAISNTVTYFADRWFAVGGASSAILMGSAADASVTGFGTALQLTRQSANSNLAAINFGQVLESADCYRCQGQQITVSFWAKALANYSGGAVTLTVVTGTGSNQTAANMIAGSWTGSATTTATFTPGTLMARQSMTAVIPASTTQIGFYLTWTPTGTAGAADGLQLNGFQFEVGPSASAFEHRDIQVELEICQRYAWVIAEPASAVIIGAGTTITANNQTYYMATPVQFYKAPTVTVSAGSFKVAAGAAFAAASSLTAGTTHTPNAISVTTTNTAAAGIGALLGGGGGSGYIIASADF
jgi:hypothetical protein